MQLIKNFSGNKFCINYKRNAHKKLLRHKSKRANNAGSKPQYLNENMVGQAKILAPYGLK